jgi:hypothetical protein
MLWLALLTSGAAGAALVCVVYAVATTRGRA